ncbi:nadh ubiquinone subunit [Ophiostoma piceae UAMH 11346]|uniref:Nadh ubiquinone subunit n=1 Tax=Ophiostoma piceae (strain UAMH 11346) TaxID=1262450 RepID=S3CBB5_OPHP1|nr:nadh ubiquinone subunit [Ophiostoma piceae UAMH 11346]
MLAGVPKACTDTENSRFTTDKQHVKNITILEHVVHVEVHPAAMAEGNPSRETDSADSIGRDLEGNTYWEFNDIRHGGTEAAPTAKRMRRIVKYPRGTHPGSVMVSPVWHQWLRHVRFDPPSIQEQQMEVRRREQMRLLAAKADARWADAKRVEGPIQAGELIGAAAQAAAVPPTQLPAHSTPKTTVSPGAASSAEEAEREPEPVHAHAQQPARPKDDPWDRARGAPGEQWQPADWTPTPKK